MDKTNAADGSLNARREDLAAYALDALEPGERAAVERLLTVSADARMELRELQEGAELLSVLAGELDPPDGLRDRILSAASVPQAGGVSQRAALTDDATQNMGWIDRAVSWASSSRIAYAGSSLAIAGIVGLTIYFGVDNARMSRQVQDLSSQVTESKATIEGLQSTVTASSQTIEEQKNEVTQLQVLNSSLQDAMRDTRWLAYLTSSGGFNVARWLVGNQNAPEADGQLLVNANNSAAVLVHGLPVQPEGKEYHLWLEGPTFRDPVAIFNVNEAGQARIEFELPRPISEYTRAIVTLEDAARFIPRPTGQEVLQSQ